LYLQEYNDLEDIGIGDPSAVRLIQAENVHFDRNVGAAMALLKDRASATISSTAKGEGRRQQ
jgi:hypothetical protein